MNHRSFAKLFLPTFIGMLALAACVTPVAPSIPTQAPTATVAEAIAVTSAPTTMGKLKVVATFSFLGDLVKNVGGDKIDVRTLVGPNGDTHEYEPTPSDAAKLADADVICEVGLEFEAWLNGLYQSSASKAMRVDTSEGVKTRTFVENGKEETDPHIWQNVQNAIIMVKNIEAGLAKADPINADAYKTNADVYVKTLEALDKEIETAANQLPKEERKIVTSHDALGYFAERYGFSVEGSVIASLSTESGEPSAQDIVKLVDAIKQTNTKAIFLESMSNPKLVERVAQEAGVKIGPELFTDALGDASSPGATYVDALRYNVNAIINTLK